MLEQANIETERLNSLQRESQGRSKLEQQLKMQGILSIDQSEH